MNYKSIADLVRTKAAELRSQPENKPIVNSGMVPAGWYDATIGAVDAKHIETEGRFLLCFDTSAGPHWESIFLFDRGGKSLGYSLNTLLTGLFAENEHAKADYLETFAIDAVEAANLLRGFVLRIEVKPGPGYVIEGAFGEYLAVKVESGEVIAEHPDSIQELRRRVEALGHQRSRNRIVNAEAKDPDRNIEALCNARKAILDTQRTEDTSESEMVGS